MTAEALKTMAAANSDIPRETFAAYLCDQETLDMLAPCVKERGWSPERIQMGGIANAIRAVSVLPSPHYLIVDLSESADPVNDIESLASICEADTAVLALGTKNDVKLFRQILQAGIHDYILKPVGVETMREAIAELIMMVENADEPDINYDAQKRIAFVGVRGGIGASSIALATATAMAHHFKRNIMHLDLDLHFGGSALALDMEPGRGLQEALENPGRIDDLFLARATLNDGDHLTMMAAESPLQENATPSAEALVQTIETIRENHEHITLDIPRTMLPTFMDGLNIITDFYLVTDLSLKATRDCIRIMAFLQKNAPEAKIYLISNQSFGSDQELSQTDFESSVERKISWQLPHDSKAFMKAEKMSQSLFTSDPSSRLSKQISAIAQHILGVDKDVHKDKGFLKKLIFGKGKSKS